jgi:hypothetical protein
MQRISFLHVRNTKDQAIDPRGGITYAYREVSPTTIEYAVARCSKLDNFVKAYGRTKASGRLASNTYRRVFQGTAAQFRDAVHANKP